MVYFVEINQTPPTYSICSILGNETVSNNIDNWGVRGARGSRGGGGSFSDFMRGIV